MCHVTLGYNIVSISCVRRKLQVYRSVLANKTRGECRPARLKYDEARIGSVLQRWQASCEALASALGKPGAEFLDLAGDVRTVLGIARRVGEARQMKAGVRMISSKEHHEVPA